MNLDSGHSSIPEDHTIPKQSQSRTDQEPNLDLYCQTTKECGNRPDTTQSMYPTVEIPRQKCTLARYPRQIVPPTIVGITTASERPHASINAVLGSMTDAVMRISIVVPLTYIQHFRGPCRRIQHVTTVICNGIPDPRCFPRISRTRSSKEWVLSCIKEKIQIITCHSTVYRNEEIVFILLGTRGHKPK